MSTIVFLIVIVGSQLTVLEMPNMGMCESVGGWIEDLKPSAKWTCIEGER